MIARMLDCLVLAPHPDDAELGMGGAILKMLAEGLRVGVLDLTDGEPTPPGSTEIRAQETAAATELLGLAWRENLGLPNRSVEPTLAARHQLAGVIRQQLGDGAMAMLDRLRLQGGREGSPEVVWGATTAAKMTHNWMELFEGSAGRVEMCA